MRCSNYYGADLPDTKVRLTLVECACVLKKHFQKRRDADLEEPIYQETVQVCKMTSACFSR